MNARRALRSTPTVPALLLLPLALLFGEAGARAGDFPRDVKGKPAFSSVGDKRFDSAAEACRQWIKEWFPKDSYVRVEEANEQSFWCHRKEPDGSPQSQAAVSRAIKCPDNAHEVGGHDLPCECNEGLVAAGDVCKPEEAKVEELAAAPASAKTSSVGQDDCAKLEKMTPGELKNDLTKRMEMLTSAVNDAFARSPELPDDSEGYLKAQGLEGISKAEVYGITARIAPKPITTGKEKSTAKFPTLKLAKEAWPILYGHALERLVANQLREQKCLSAYVERVPNVRQMKEGGGPDFRGTGKAKGLEWDVTTPERAKTKGTKTGYIYITYTRLLELDESGHAVRK